MAVAAAGAVRSPRNITPVLERIVALNPDRVLDVGAGYGQWGALLREYLDDYVGYRLLHGIEPDRHLSNRSSTLNAYDFFLTVDFPGPMMPALAPRYDLVLMDGFLDRLVLAPGHDALNAALKLAPDLIVTARKGDWWAETGLPAYELSTPGLGWFEFSDEQFFRALISRGRP